MLIDLHTHSNRSDGTDDPSDLVGKAKTAGLDVVALTDHDSTSGWDDAATAAEKLDIELVKGIEISCRCEGRSVHLLGYGFDPEDEPLLAELRRVLDGRDGRLPAMIERLQDLDIDITTADVDAWSTKAAASGRPHVADALIDKGVVSSREEAFDRYLKPGRPAYVDRYAVGLERAIALLHDAGGVSVLAHPWARGSHKVLTASKIEDLKSFGLNGIEVDHNDHDQRARASLRSIALELDLIRTGSSDYHGRGKTNFELGCNTTDREQFERLKGRWDTRNPG